MDWKKIKAEYIKGGTSYRKLAEKYNAPFGTLRKVAAKEGWRELRDRTRLKTDTRLTDAVSTEQANRLARIHKVADDLLIQLESIVSDFKREDLIMDKQCLKQITGALKDIKDIQSLKSPLDIEEQKARIENLRKQAAANDDSNKEPIRVIIDDGVSDYSK